MNLLTDPLFRVEIANGPRRLSSLPALLTALGADEVESLPGLQRHQEDAFHIFLCQLAASVLLREKKSNPIQEEAFWREGIRRLTGRDDDCAWTLVVKDCTKPAFMQSAIPEAISGQLKSVAQTPDEMDILATAKNHDVKTARGNSATADEWIFALVNFQTTAGFFGRGNYGIARMNGGHASRPVVELQLSPRAGKRWVRCTSRLLELHNSLLAPPWPYRQDGSVLLWTLTWDGNSSLALSSLDPFFIEIARLIRLTHTTTRRYMVTGMPSTCTRIDAKAQLGVLGDPWTPVNTGKKEVTALTVSASGFTPDLLHKIIFEDGIEAALLQQAATEEIGLPMALYAAVLVRGQGTTDGFHTTLIPIPTKVGFALFARRDEKLRLQETSKQWITDGRTMQNKVMKYALFTLLEAGPEKVNFDKTEIAAWVDKLAKDFTQAWSHDYFDWLWRCLDQENTDKARVEWLEALEKKAKHILGSAIERLPVRLGRRLRSRVAAQGRYTGALNKHFPELKEARDARRTT